MRVSCSLTILLFPLAIFRASLQSAIPSSDSISPLNKAASFPGSVDYDESVVGDQARDDEEREAEDEETEDDDKVIVILVDGVRWDYVAHDPGLKGFPQIAQDGVRAKYVRPVFPSNSYPNWYSISTGLYPESHGFIQNEMYDASRQEFFLKLPHPNASNAHWWTKAEPIWINSERFGHRSALYWWGGCRTTFSGKHASACLPHTSWETKNDEVRERLHDAVEKMMEDQLDFIGLYYGQVDHYGHIYGPDSPQTKRALADIDAILFELQENITKKAFDDNINILVVSDHGMTSTHPNEVSYVSLEPFSNLIRYQLNSVSSSMILPEEGKLDQLYKKLIDSNLKGIHVYKKDDIPEKYHIRNSPLVLPIWIQADKGYYIKPLKDAQKSLTNDTTVYHGYHGYDPFEVSDMNTIFFAKGPAFKKNYISEPLENVDFYNLISNILEIEPKPNNGSVERYKKLLDDDDSASDVDEDYQPNDDAAHPRPIFASIFFAFVLLYYATE